MLVKGGVTTCLICKQEFKHVRTSAITCSDKCYEKLKRLKGLITHESGIPHSGVAGITFDSKLEMWRVKDKLLYLGIFKDLREALARLEQHKYLKLTKRCSAQVAKEVYRNGERGKLNVERPGNSS